MSREAHRKWTYYQQKYFRMLSTDKLRCNIWITWEINAYITPNISSSWRFVTTQKDRYAHRVYLAHSQNRNRMVWKSIATFCLHDRI